MKYHALKSLLTILLLFFAGLSFGQDPSDLIAEAEAEDGVLVGVSVLSSNAGYSGTGYVGNFANEEDMVTMTVSIPKSDLYKIYIRYGGFSGTKTQDVLINGLPASSIIFPGTSEFTSIEAGTYYFESGENSVSIKKNWGFMAVDKIEIYPAAELEFQIDHELVDLKADEHAYGLYEFLKTQFGERIISGQTSSYFNDLKALAGNTPMLQVGDLVSYTEGYPYLWKDGGHTLGATDDGTVAHLIIWHNTTSKKGLVSLQWHWHSPSGGVAGNNNFYTENTDFDVREAVKPGTAEYELIIRDIDDIAIQLKRFENAGVPILWRPLHEAGGGWFWWGAHGPEACLELYDIIYERLMFHHQIHNLIWVWSTPEEEWYPGNDRVDIIGFDSYPGANNYSSQRYWFERLYTLTEGKKLVAMTENGPIPDPDECFKMGAPWAYFMSWSDVVAEQNETTHLQSVFSNPSVITLESNNLLWRSSLYPDTWYPGFKDLAGRFLHDFSYAGYHLGEDSIPFITENVVDVTQAPYSADNTGVDDVTTIIQDALDDVGAAGGGVVYLPPGTYRIREASSTANADAALHMKYDNVVLRGAGPQATFIFHDQAALRQKDVVHIRKSWSNWDTKLGTQSLISEDLMEPTKVIPVESVAGFSVGDLIVVRNNLTTAFAEEHLMEGIWDNSWLDGVMFLRKIDSIDTENKAIIIDIPTRYYLKTRDAARVYHAGEHIKECGIENLSLGNKYNSKSGWGEDDYTSSGTGAYDVHGSHVMHFKYAQDCWVKNVSTYKPAGNLADIEVLSNCLIMNQCRNITIDSCDFQKSQYEGGGGNGYMYTFSGNDCLVKNSRANDSRHNYDFKHPHCNGNVILNCRGENSKYSSDYHMYLSMANLFDGFIVNGDYLECAFRPYGGEVLHGYPSTQSVFYNTYGENYHVNKNYIIDSRQFDWGIVSGTSGPFNQVKTTPVSGTQGGYTYNTAPEDYVEGIGRGSDLRPVSLYKDQMKRRMSGYKPTIRFYDVAVEARDNYTGLVLAGAEVILNDSIQITDTLGLVYYTDLTMDLSLSVAMENYNSYPKSIRIISTDTTFRIALEPYQYDVSIGLLDSRTEEPFWGVNVFLNEIRKVSDDNGFAYYTLPFGTYDYLVDKFSYQNESGSLSISSDTTFTFKLTRTQAYMKFRLKEGEKPINIAYVSIGNDSIESNNLGISLFKEMAVNEEYNYTVRKEGYALITGSLFLVTDTTLNVNMIVTSNGENTFGSSSFKSKIWPNPVEKNLYIECLVPNQSMSLLITDIQGRVISDSKPTESRYSINVENLSPGIYHIHLQSEDVNERHLFVKK
jgi:mannan endo-1,4-beta-mannosidase